MAMDFDAFFERCDRTLEEVSATSHANQFTATEQAIEYKITQPEDAHSAEQFITAAVLNDIDAVLEQVA